MKLHPAPLDIYVVQVACTSATFCPQYFCSHPLYPLTIFLRDTDTCTYHFPRETHAAGITDVSLTSLHPRSALQERVRCV